MKTDREWLLDTLADAVADICWERMKQFPAAPGFEKIFCRETHLNKGCVIADQ